MGNACSTSGHSKIEPETQAPAPTATKAPAATAVSNGTNGVQVPVAAKEEAPKKVEVVPEPVKEAPAPVKEEREATKKETPPTNDSSPEAAKEEPAPSTEERDPSKQERESTKEEPAPNTASEGREPSKQEREPTKEDPAPPSKEDAPTDTIDSSYPPTGLSNVVKNCAEWIKKGCGNEEYICEEKGALFRTDVVPDEMPDFSEHCNYMTDVLQAEPQIYHDLKGLTTSLGVNLAHCIKTGVDNRGHPFIKTVGIACGDEESYTLFAPLLDKVISQRHKGFGPDDVHKTNMNFDEILTDRLDPSGKYVKTVRVRTGRSIRGFRLPPRNDFEERRKLEALIVKGLKNLEGDLAGDYYPLTGSRSYAEKPNGMTVEKQDQLRENGNLFQEPDSTLLLASGCGRHWPDARGIFHNEAKNCFVWANEEDHMRIISMQTGDDLQAVSSRFIKLCDAVQKSLKSDGYDFMHHDRLGYILTCPSNLGTGLRAGVMINIPLCSAHADFKTRLDGWALQARGIHGVDTASEGGVFDISNRDRLGKSEVELINVLIKGVKALIAWEQELESSGEAPKAAEPEAAQGEDTYPPNGLAPGVKTLPQWIQLGCGDAEYNCPEKGATFPGDKLPDEMPDFSEHNNFMTEILSGKPELWEQYKDVRTSLGGGLAKCIKTGVDNKGHPFIKTVGLVACDEESYTAFKDLFDPVISARHGGYAADAIHPTNLNLDDVIPTKLDPTGKYVLTARVRTGRSVQGFRLPPAIQFEERRKLEGLVVNALLKLEGELKGDYFPLHGSRSYETKMGGMSPDKEEELRSAGNLFQEPDSTLLLSSGCGRHWPDARGIFHNDSQNCFVWLNEEDHIRIVSMEKGDDIQNVFGRFVKLCNGVQEVLKADGYGFMHTEHLGYLLSCPSNLGTGLRAGVMVKIPLLSSQADFRDKCAAIGLQARGGGGVDSEAKGGIYDISNADRLGKSEVDLVNVLITGVLELIKQEQELEAQQGSEEKGEPAAADAPEATDASDSYPPTGLASGVKKLPEWIQLGCGDAEYICTEKGALFPGDECPPECPDLSNHNNFMAEVLRENTHLYDELKDKKTSLGVSLAKCIKTGVDNLGHPHIKTVGLVGGDEESFTLFKDLFDPIISARHNGFAPDAIHPTNLDLSQLDPTRLDETGKYVLTSRVRTGRSVRGYRLPPACKFEERRELERIIVKGLLNLGGELKGEYFPLHGSRSYEPKMGGMSEDKEEELRQNGNLFQEPDSTLLLSSGCGRHWPDARGIFHNEGQSAFVWVNEEDHIRVVSMQKGDDIQAVFSRFVNLSNEVQAVLKEEGADFMHSEHLGYILACPSNLGTGLRAGSLVKIPLVSSREDFKAIMGRLGLQARGGGGVDSEAQGGVYDISNADRLGKSEIDLVNTMIRGVSTIVKWEQKLEAGESIDDDIPQ